MTRLEELERELTMLRASGNGQTHPVVLNALIEVARVVTKIEDRTEDEPSYLPPPVQRAGPDAMITGDESLRRLNDLLQQAKSPVVIEHIHGPRGVSAVPVTQGRWDAMVFMAKHQADQIAVLERRLSIMSENLRVLWKSTTEIAEAPE